MEARLLLCWLLFLLCITGQTAAREKSAVTLEPGKDNIPAPLHCSTAFENSTTFEEVRYLVEHPSWQFYPSGHITQSFRNKAIWCRLNFSLLDSRPWFVSVLDPNIEHIEVYLGGASSAEYFSGSLLDFKERPISNHNFHFPVDALGDYEVFIRLKSTFLNAPVRFQTQEFFYNNNLILQILSSFALGSSLPLVILIIAARRISEYHQFQASYWIIGFVVAHTINAAALQGYGFEFFWPEHPYWNRVASLVVFPCGLLLFWRYLDTLKCEKFHWERLLFNATWLLTVGFSYAFIATGQSLLLILGIITLLICATTLFIRHLYFLYGNARYAEGKFWALWMFSVGMTVLQSFGILNLRLNVELAMSLNYLSLIILLGWNLLKLLQSSHLKLMSTLQDKMAKEELLLQYKTGQIEGLERIVAERTQDLRNTMQKLHLKNLQLKKSGHTDSLTGIMNRLAIDAYIDEQWGISKQSNNSLSIAIIDADLFKKVNDTYGHDAGDACLKFLARTFMQMLNDSKLRVARYGGEEFLVVAPGMNKAKLFQLIELTREAIEDIAIKHDTYSFHITISAGISDNQFEQCDHFAQLFKQADQALYQAKEQGRNQIVIAK